MECMCAAYEVHDLTNNALHRIPRINHNTLNTLQLGIARYSASFERVPSHGHQAPRGHGCA